MCKRKKLVGYLKKHLQEEEADGLAGKTFVQEEEYGRLAGKQLRKRKK